MTLKNTKYRWLVAIIFTLSVSAFAETPKNIRLDVYKSPTCGCCEAWIEHVENDGFKTRVHHPNNLAKLKYDKGISPQYQSCHTAVSKEGYIFEGHIPADIIRQFLADPPANAIGLAVPGMPAGSPGMEMGDRRDDYDVWLLRNTGNDSIYKHIDGNR